MRQPEAAQQGGETLIWTRDEQTGIITPVGRQHNDFLYTWGYIAAQCIGKKNTNFAISAMYLEFENVASPSNPVTIPSFELSDGVEYYDNLASSMIRDYLRVPVLQDPSITVLAGYESLLSPDQGNQLNFMAMTAGVSGVHGRTFSAGVNSKIFGAALVATPSWGDKTQDVIFARVYYTSDKQVTKEASTQVGITWSPWFGTG